MGGNVVLCMWVDYYIDGSGDIPRDVSRSIGNLHWHCI
jgi:hypothetical protein